MSRADRDSVERALDVHLRDGRIRGWGRHPEGGYLVDIFTWGPERFRTTREAHCFVMGLAAAKYAADRQAWAMSP